MNTLRFVADVHISPLTVTTLRLAGYDIVRVPDILPKASPDSVILEFARIENRIILTQDLDFSVLVALGRYVQPSLITLRLSSARPDFVSQRLLSILPELEQPLIEGCAVTIEDNSIRLRRLPIC